MMPADPFFPANRHILIGKNHIPLRVSYINVCLLGILCVQAAREGMVRPHGAVHTVKRVRVQTKVQNGVQNEYMACGTVRGHGACSNRTAFLCMGSLHGRQGRAEQSDSAHATQA